LSIFFDENSQSAIFEKKRSHFESKAPEDQGEKPKTQVNMKHIVIIGAGISGLSLAWFLQKKFQNRLKITLFEKSNRVGGCIQTVFKNDFLFEMGPHSLRSYGKATLNLIRELGLEKEMVFADPSAKKRFLYFNQKLHQVPSTIPEMARQPWIWPMLPSLLWEYFRKSQNHSEETVLSFFSRRFGKKITETLLEPMCLGIFAGDISQLSLKSCFPNLYAWEKTFGSVLRGLFRQPSQSGQIFSFRRGLETLPRALADQLNIDLHLNVTNIQFEAKNQNIEFVHPYPFEADHVFLAISPQEITHFFPNPDLKQFSTQSIAIAHLGYRKSILKQNGFGYLVPTKENESILGMIWSSSIFPTQNWNPEETRLTVMMNGSQNQNVALEAARSHLGIEIPPEHISYQILKHAIPQYTIGHAERVGNIIKQLSQNITLLGNHFHGISVGDCITHAELVANTLN